MFAADIWSFGITAIELAAGRAPNSLYAPAKVLTKTILEASPKLDRDGNRYKYSRAMADLVDQCLQKDAAKRPSAEKLLHHAFFKQAKPNKFLAGAILADLPPLVERQGRRRNPSLNGTDTVASWDFSNSTLPASLRSLAATPGLLSASPSLASTGDPFANFSSYNSAPGSPTSPGFPQNRRMPSLGREREPSTGSVPGSRRHARGVSFDLKESPLEGAAEDEGSMGTTSSAVSGTIEEEAAGKYKQQDL